MTKKELELFRKMLTQRLDELTQKSDTAIAGLLNSTVNSADPLGHHLGRSETMRFVCCVERIN